MKKLILSLIFIFVSICVEAQELYGYVKDADDSKRLDFASVVALDENNSPLSYCLTDKNGYFNLSLQDDKKVRTVSVTILGYKKKLLPIGSFKNGMVISLHPERTTLREVVVKSKRLMQRSDTLIYSVSGFRQKQDRSIADVLAKMPGIEVAENGMIKYQGKPINKFYVEGMDLMGGKYSMASENISASKVKNVEVLRNHQPVKALKGVQFSDQAALNLVLNDDAKNIWTGSLEMGAGGQLQKGIGENLLRDGRAVSLLFSSRAQNISMYKWNNTGKDIQHEIRDLTSEAGLNDYNSGWIGNIHLNVPELKQERYNCNDTRILASNGLIKLGTEAKLRLQTSFLYDKTIGFSRQSTTYTNILGMPVVDESFDARMYRREFKTELQYEKNADSTYINNVLRSSFGWNNSFSSTLFQGKSIRESVKPTNRMVEDELKLILKIGKERSFNFNAFLRYQNSPSLLAIIDSVSPFQRLTLESITAKMLTGFRHRIMKMYVSYDAQMNYNQQKVQTILSDKHEEEYRNIEFKLTPRLSFERYGLRTALAIPVSLMNYRISTGDSYHLYLKPYLFLGYKLGALWDFTVNCNRQYNPYDFRTAIPLIYYVDYYRRNKGTGTYGRTKSDAFSGKIEYSNPINGLFCNASGQYLRMNGVPVYEYEYKDGIYTMGSTGLVSHNNQLLLSSELSKAFSLGKMTCSLGGDYQKSTYESLVSGTICPCNLRSYSAYFKVAYMPFASFSVEEKSTFKNSKMINKALPQFSMDAISDFKHSLTLFVMPGKWKFSWLNELYHSNDKSLKTSYFSNLSVSFSSKKYEISMILNNIFGTKEYDRSVLSDRYFLYSYSLIRPREALVKCAFYL